MTAPITSARVRELIAAATPYAFGPRQVLEEARRMEAARQELRHELEQHAARIAKALELLERMQAGDAGLATTVIAAFARTGALVANYTGNVDQLVAQAMVDETMRTSFAAALAALVGEGANG